MARCLLMLWRQFICLGCLSTLLAVTISILVGIDGWLMFETAGEVAGDVGARISIGLAFGLIAGTLAMAFFLPYLLWRPAAVRERAAKVSRIATVVIVLSGGGAILGVMVRWAMAVGVLDLTNQTYVLVWFCLFGLWVALAAVLYIAAPQRFTAKLSFADALSGRATRRVLLVAGVGAVAAVLSNQVGSKPARRSAAPAKPRSPRPNILLVSFDALSAEDMSLYGYHLPTTPNIDAFARSSAVFSNHYGTSTFTTSCIASMLTGRYPSDTRIFQYGGRLRGIGATQTLPNVLRAAGYTTAASVANPGAHPDCMGFGGAFDVLPPPPIKDFATRETVRAFHSATLAAEAGFVSRIAPYLLEQASPRVFGQTHSTFPPGMSFQQAEAILDGLPKPYFLWVHVFAPHFPYLPEPPFLKEFLHSNELRTHSDFAKLFDLKGFNYSPSKQPLIDHARLRYDEWIAQADDAFGRFMSKFQASGRLRDTAVMVSSDHGESFQGGYVGHGGARQLRPVLHVPLLVRLPGQTEERRIATVTDHTGLAPTILEIAGVARPGWMDGGQSLCGLMRGEGGIQRPLAFTEYFETNSSFKPISKGTVGVIDGQHQFVLDLENKTAGLYDLDQAHEQSIDLSVAEPELSATLHGELEHRFPNVFGG